MSSPKRKSAVDYKPIKFLSNATGWTIYAEWTATMHLSKDGHCITHDENEAFALAKLDPASVRQNKVLDGQWHSVQSVLKDGRNSDGRCLYWPDGTGAIFWNWSKGEEIQVIYFKGNGKQRKSLFKSSKEQTKAFNVRMRSMESKAAAKGNPRETPVGTAKAVSLEPLPEVMRQPIRNPMEHILYSRAELFCFGSLGCGNFRRFAKEGDSPGGYETHPYLAEKLVLPVGTLRICPSRRQFNDIFQEVGKGMSSDMKEPYLIVPLVRQLEEKDRNPMRGDSSGFEFVSFEVIDAVGNKRFQKLDKGQTQRGAYWCSSESAMRDCGSVSGNALLVVAEGVATLLSGLMILRHELPGREIAGFAAMDCGNIPPVVSHLRTLYPANDIWILADRDANGVGEAKAVEAVKRFLEDKGADYENIEVKPVQFTNDEIALFQELSGTEKKPSDYNDKLRIAWLKYKTQKLRASA